MPKTSPRRGNVLILFAMMLFGLMALAALVIDIGFARLAQRQMQSAVDSAAIEGLRFRDRSPPNAEPANESLDMKRRIYAKSVVALLYEPSASSADINFGVANAITYSGGVGDQDVIGQPDLDAPRLVYEPGDESDSGEPEHTIKGLRTNLVQGNENIPYGDMVSGQYVDEPGPAATAERIRDFHKERPDYTRDDFEHGQEPPSAFMVRLRRTGEPFPSDDRAASAGPSLPYIFAWGSTFPRIRTETNPHVVADGIKVRATGVADARPVVCVGRTQEESPDIPGHLGVAISLQSWEDLSNTDGEAKTLHPVDDLVIGAVVETDEDSLLDEEQIGYISIFHDTSSRVIGFGYASIDSEGTVTKRWFNDDDSTFPIAPFNASAVLCYPVAGPSDGLEQVFAENRDLQGRPDILHAPVSVR